MDRSEAMAIVEPRTFQMFPGKAVTHMEARSLLGEARFRRLANDPIRRLGPTPTTVYHWNVADYVQFPDLRKDKDVTEALIQCPSCGGEGKLLGMFPVYRDSVPQSERKPVVEMDCDRCRGAGKVPQLMAQWVKDGKQLRQSRLDAGFGLREFCETNGINPVVRSNRERGIIDPQTPDEPYQW